MHSKHGWNIGERRKNILFYSSFVVLYPEHTSIVLRLKLLTYTTYWTITTKLWLTMLISLSHKKEIKRFRSQRIPPCHEGQVNRLVCHCITPAYNNGLWMRIWTCEAKIKKERITDEEKIIAHISPILQNSVTPTFPNSLFDQESGRPKTTLWICYLQINQLFLFSFLIYFFIPLNLSNSNGQGCKQFFFLERKKVRWGHHFRLRFYTAHQTKCSTGWKFAHLGVPFTGRNDLNRTKIWMPRRSKIWTPNTRSPHNERFRVNEKSGQVFQSVQNSNGAMSTSVKRTHAP